MDIKIKKLHPLAKMPTYATDGAGWFDLYSTNLVVMMVQESRPVIVGTGLAFEIPPGHGMFIFSRSGHGFKFDTRLANCVGCIDSDYRGEVMVKLTCDVERDESMPMSIIPGDRVAQACILPIPAVSFSWGDDLPETKRGAGGFGSTGK